MSLETIIEFPWVLEATAAANRPLLVTTIVASGTGATDIADLMLGEKVAIVGNSYTGYVLTKKVASDGLTAVVQIVGVVGTFLAAGTVVGAISSASIVIDSITSAEQSIKMRAFVSVLNEDSTETAAGNADILVGVGGSGTTPLEPTSAVPAKAEYTVAITASGQLTLAGTTSEEVTIRVLKR